MVDAEQYEPSGMAVILSLMSCITCLVSEVYLGHGARDTNLSHYGHTIPRRKLRTSGVEITDEVDVETGQLVGKIVLDRIWNGSKD